MIETRICVTGSNEKIGKTLNISLPAVVSCPKGVPCASLCYDLKLYGIRPTVKAARYRNWKILLNDRKDYFSQLAEIIEKKKPEFFRWHVGGDIPNLEYFNEMVELALRFPKVKFMCYTKSIYPAVWLAVMHCTPRIPKNLSVMRSIWGKWNSMPNASMFRKAIFVPRGATAGKGLVCPGKCDGCRACWNPKSNILFNQH